MTGIGIACATAVVTGAVGVLRMIICIRSRAATARLLLLRVRLVAGGSHSVGGRCGKLVCLQKRRV